LPLILLTLVANFANSTAGVFDTGGKFATGLVDKSGEVAIGGAP
jgi:hypothetical protein